MVDFEISPPPAKPREPRGKSRYRLLPLVVVAVLILGAAIWWIGGGVPGVILVVLLGALAAWQLPRWERVTFLRRVRQREQSYRDYLDVLRGRLAALTTAQQTTWAEQDPEPAGCVRLATNSPDRLWHADPRTGFNIRIGTTSRRGNIRVVAPVLPLYAEAEPLIEAARELARSAEEMPGAPLRVALRDRNAVRGSPDAVLAAARAVLVQLATNYSPERLKLFVLCSEQEVSAWRWARWLPHVLANDGRTRCIAWDIGTAQRLLADANPRSTLVVVADPTLAGAVPMGVPVLLLGDAPRAFAVIIDVTAPSLTIGGQNQSIEHVDTATVELAERLARALAARRPRRTAALDDQSIVEVHLDGSGDVVTDGDPARAVIQE